MKPVHVLNFSSRGITTGEARQIVKNRTESTSIQNRVYSEWEHGNKMKYKVIMNLDVKNLLFKNEITILLFSSEYT